jgi:hypothetical protein
MRAMHLTITTAPRRRSDQPRQVSSHHSLLHAKLARRKSWRLIDLPPSLHVRGSPDRAGWDVDAVVYSLHCAARRRFTCGFFSCFHSAYFDLFSLTQCYFIYQPNTPSISIYLRFKTSLEKLRMLRIDTFTLHPFPSCSPTAAHVLLLATCLSFPLLRDVRVSSTAWTVAAVLAGGLKVKVQNNCTIGDKYFDLFLFVKSASNKSIWKEYYLGPIWIKEIS